MFCATKPTGVSASGRDMCYVSHEDGGIMFAARVALSFLLAGGAAVAQQYVISTIAGNGTRGYSGDAGPAIKSQLGSVYGIALDTFGNLYIADGDNARVRKITPNGIIATVAGNGTPGYSGDGGLALNAQLSSSLSVALDMSDNLYIADSLNNRVRKVSSDGIISTVAGTGIFGFWGAGGPSV